MPSRRNLVLTASALAAGLAAGARAEGTENIDYLLVQTSKELTFDKAANRLTLVGVSPVTLFFSDRPERIAGNMKTADFAPFWSKGRDSFEKDPPNADVSVLDGSHMRQIVVVLKDPVLEGDALHYTVRTLEGEMPVRASDVSVFIDIIGMPWTPVSFAGARRRAYRRAVFYR
jgi:non-ribosomal peptide synthetase component E (peptide arylation enzyme)